MRSILDLVIVLGTFVLFTTSMIVPSSPSLTQNISDNADPLTQAAPLNMSSSSGLSSTAGLVAINAPKDYTVIPLKPDSVRAVKDKIMAFAVSGSVKTITDKYRPEYNYVLYWSLRASSLNAQFLQEELDDNVKHPKLLFH